MVIPTVTAVAIKRFRSKQPETGENAHREPKHPAVGFLLGAWNRGDFSETDKYIALDILAYTNGRSFTSERGGPATVQESIESWRTVAPDVRMELHEEIRDKGRIAIEFRITGTLTEAAGPAAQGKPIEVAGSAFLSIKKGKVIAVRTVFDTLTVALETGAAVASAQPRK